MAVDTVTLNATGTATLTQRWNNVAVTNDSGVVCWVSTNGVAPSGTGANDGEVQIPNGQTMVLSNELYMWNQSQIAIPYGSNNQWSQALDGVSAGTSSVNPGTVVKISLTSPTGTVTIAGCG